MDQYTRTILLECIVHGWEIMFDDDDDEEVPERNVEQKINSFAEDVVPRFSSKQFKRNFRMDADTFEDFLQKLQSVNPNQVQKGHPQLPLPKQAMITVWYLANMESFRWVFIF